jgi:alkylated DNA repair dioxygenase AlkB
MYGDLIDGMNMMEQGQLFATPRALPSGMLYKGAFITTDEEAVLLSEIIRLPLHEARYKEFTAKRRIMSYGGSYDFSVNELIPAGPIPSFLRALQERIAEWVGVPAEEFTHALISEYKIGTQLGWHRDVPDFEIIVGISLAGPCRMRLRHYLHRKEAGTKSLAVDLEPRSAYQMGGEAHWGWQHRISPTKTARYSITFRTRAKGLRKTP